jgi:hypothetical protein
MEESCNGDVPKGGKRGVKVCKDKSKTKNSIMGTFNIGKKYKLGKPDPKPEEVQPVGGTHMNVRELSGSPGEYKPSTQYGTTVPVNPQKAIKIEKANTRQRELVEKESIKNKPKMKKKPVGDY